MSNVPATWRGGFTQFLERLYTFGLEWFGLYYGVYRAKVVANEDPNAEGQPDPQGRLRVRVRAIGDTNDTPARLAYPIVPLAGSGYGFKSLPPVDGFVYVVFENGRPDAALWIGGWWGSDAMPDDLKPAKAHGWYTPEGHKILLDGQDGSEVIRIEHTGGAMIEIDSSGNVNVKQKSGSKVNVGDGADTANEPAALGNTLKGLLEQLCDACVAITVTTPMGPATLLPTSTAQFQAIRGQLQRLLSQVVNVK